VQLVVRLVARQIRNKPKYIVEFGLLCD